MPPQKRTPSARPRSRRTATPATVPGDIRRNVLFNGVPDNLIAEHLPAFNRRAYRAGDVIFDEYSRGRDLYLILEGRVRIKKYTKFGVESLLAVLHPGDFFGELSVIDSLPRSARAQAMDDCAVMSLSPATFRSLIRKSDAFTMNLLGNLGVRLRTMYQTFVLELGRSAVMSMQMQSTPRVAAFSILRRSSPGMYSRARRECIKSPVSRGKVQGLHRVLQSSSLQRLSV